MFLKRILAINTAMLACFGSLLLGLGLGDASLPIWMLLAAVGSIWLTDILGWIRLSHRWANLIILAVVLLSFGEVVRSRGDLLAVAIARVLVFVEIVLLFRDKDRRAFWHLIVLSLLQVVVASSFEQSPLFGMLLLFYTFVALSSMTLLFLFGEGAYFHHNATVPHQHGLRATFDFSRENWWRITQIGVATLIMGPLSLFLQHRARPEEAEELEEGSRETPDRPLTSRVTAGRWPLTHAEANFYNPGAVSGGRASLTFAFWRNLIAMTCKTFVIAAILFVLTPRTEVIGSFNLDVYGWNSGAGARTVGFNNEIELGSLGTALLDDGEVLRIAFETPSTGEEYEISTPIYLRGTVLTRYVDNHWSNPMREYFDRIAGRYSRPSRESLCRQMGAEPVRQVISFEPSHDPHLFCAWPYYYERRERFYEVPDVEVHRPQGSNRERRRHVLGTAAFSRGRQLQLTPCERPMSFAAMQEHLSFRRDHMPALVALADQWIAESGIDATDPIGRARYLEMRLRTDERFSYSLTSPPRRTKNDDNQEIDHIDDFIAYNPVGHCEYFATALAMMLRSQNIPSRVVVGYHAGTYNSLDNCYQIRRFDAHSWVQAYVAPRNAAAYLPDTLEKNVWENGAWLRLDATPEVELSMLGNLSEEFNGWRDWLSYAWDHYVVGLNREQQQASIYQPLGSMLGELFHVEWWRETGAWLRLQASELMQSLREGDWLNMRAGIVASLLSLIAYLAYRFARFSYRLISGWYRPVDEQGRMLRTVRVEFYRRLETVLARYGLHREPDETQREFAANAGAALTAQPELAADLRADAPELPQLPSEIAEAFYEVRFGGKSISKERTRSIERALRELDRNAPTSDG